MIYLDAELHTLVDGLLGAAQCDGRVGDDLARDADRTLVRRGATAVLWYHVIHHTCHR